MSMIRGAISFTGGSQLKKSGIPRDAPFFKTMMGWITSENEQVIKVVIISLEKMIENLKVGNKLLTGAKESKDDQK